MSIIKEMIEGFKNPTKPGVFIQKDENAQPARYRGNESYKPSPKEMIHPITHVISTELLSASTDLIVLLKTCPELANPNLEILNEENNVFKIKEFVNANKEAFMLNLDAAVKRWADKSNYHPRAMFANEDLANSKIQIMGALYARYKKRCSNPKTITEDIIAMNNCIKMLLEINVLGIRKALSTNID